MKDHNYVGSYFLTQLTIFSTFLMGFIDAYTFLERSGVFASAQTGNIVIMVSRVFEGQWRDAIVHIFTYLGFTLGAFIGQAMIEYLKHYEYKKYYIYLFSQIPFLFLIALFQEFMGDTLIGFLLGILAGYELTVFRKFRTTSINNGIMTGNAKNLMNNLFKATFNKDREALSEFFNLSMGIGTFILGVGIGTLTLAFGSLYNLWIAFFITGMFYLWLRLSAFIRKRKSKTYNKKQEASY